MVKNKTAQAGSERDGGPNRSKSNRTILIVSALDMSWRLAIVVLVPIIGGFEIDQHLNTTPALTIIGFLLAMVGLFFILKRTMAKADEKFKARTPK